jgi:hypothetical protein
MTRRCGVDGIGRFVRRARRFLEPGEYLVVSILGREGAGRRRVAIVATDQRLLLVTLRPEQPVEISYDGLDVDFEEDGATAKLRLRNGNEVHEVVQIADIAGAEVFVPLVRERAGSAERQRASTYTFNAS